MNRFSLRILELQVAAAECSDRDEAKRILAEVAVMQELMRL